MKMLIGMLLTAGVILFSSQYMLKNMGGIPGFNMGGASGEATKGLEELGNAVIQKDVTVYQWTDSSGVTHYGGTPPTGQGQYEKKMIHANTNVMDAHKIAEEEETPKEQSRMARVGSLYSPEGVKGLMDDATGLQEQLNQRMEEQQKLLDSIAPPSSKK